MPAVLIDTMLLSLLVVGTASRDYVAKHERLRPYHARDFDLLLNNVSRLSPIVVTPHTLAETSNWLKMIGEPARSQIAVTFRTFVSTFEERYVPSRQAVEDQEFRRLWLTGIGILRELSNGYILYISDFALYREALRRGHNAANFNDLRQL